MRPSLHRTRRLSQLSQRIPMTLTAFLLGLIGWGFHTRSVQAEEFFGIQGIEFTENTVVEFEFLESNGAYQSCFGILNLDTQETFPLFCETQPSDNPQSVEAPSDFEDDGPIQDLDDFVGSPGITVPNPIMTFEFAANTPYAFYLDSTYNDRPAGLLYSTNSLNPGDRQQIIFEGGVNGLVSGGTVLRWDDTGSVLVDPDQQDQDFDDFIVRAGGHLACPFDDCP